MNGPVALAVSARYTSTLNFKLGDSNVKALSATLPVMDKNPRHYRGSFRKICRGANHLLSIRGSHVPSHVIKRGEAEARLTVIR